MMTKYPQMGMSGSRIQAQPMRDAWKPAAQEQKKGGGGMLGGMMSGLSDEHSKKNIERLTAKNDALMAALDQASQNQGSNLPPTEYPSLPSHTSFDRDPADKVAAQNVGIQATQAPPQVPPQAAAPPMGPMGMQPSPQQQNFARSANPAFNVNTGAPDMSALDEAFKRQSMGG